MHTSPSLRDRRSLNLSTSSTISNTSLPSEVFYTSANEKHFPTLPPLTPTLPTFITKENQTRRKGRSRCMLAVQISIAIFGILVLGHLAFDSLTKPAGFRLLNEHIVSTNHNPSSNHDMPDEPSIITFSDGYGHSRWTVQLPHNYSFPLRNKDSQEICRKVDLLQDRANTKYRQRKLSYYYKDQSFVEVDEAEKLGVLPLSTAQNVDKTCAKSLTFVLDDDDVAFGRSLLMMWLSYGLAKQEGRAFFVDDTRWAYGDYTSYFAPPPFQGCDRPPPHHIVPCPHSAKHLLVSSATLPWTFGSSFEQEFHQWRKKGVERSRRIYSLLRRGYEDLFHLTGEHALYAASRIAKFREEAEQHNGAVVGTHVRRGDLHPFEQQFSQDYIQLDWYGDPARRILHSQLQAPELDINGASDDFQLILDDNHSPLILATDDPELFSSEEMMQSVSPFKISKAQELVQLTTKSRLDLTSPVESRREADSVYNKFIDENTGWEGGFFSALFFSLGDSKRNGYSSMRSGSIEDERDEFSVKQARSSRELVGKAYILDIAVLGQSDHIICAISSATCRLVGVMLGFDALKDGRWINIDENRDGNRVWTWDGRR